MLSMMIVVNQGGIAPGGNNFDCKLRRESSDLEDMFLAHIGGMDCLVCGLRSAEKVVEDKQLDSFLTSRYLSWKDEALAKKVEEGKAGLEEVEAFALKNGEPMQISGKQEHLEQLLNQYI